MLVSGLEGSSQAVVIDVLNNEDLDQMRSHTSHHSSSKLYFIITYVVEFDKVHYPLPLSFQANPDPSSMQKTISRLRKEVTALKSSMAPNQIETSKFFKENNTLKSQLEDYKNENESLLKEMKERDESIKELEKIKFENTKEIRNLQKENDSMECELNKIRGHMDMIIEQLEEAEKERNRWGSTKSLIQEIEDQKREIERLGDDVENYKNEIKDLKQQSRNDKSRILQLESELRALFDKYRCEPIQKPIKRSISVKPNYIRKSHDSFSRSKFTENEVRESIRSPLSPYKSEKNLQNSSYDSNEIQRRLDKIQNMMKIVKD